MSTGNTEPAATVDTTTPATAPSASVAKVKQQKPKKTFMLHDPLTFESKGKFKSTDFRYAALKAASRGYKDIRLRITDTKLVYQFAGDIITLDKPQKVKRGEREIEYKKKPSVKFVTKYLYSGEIDETASPEGEPPKQITPDAEVKSEAPEGATASDNAPKAQASQAESTASASVATRDTASSKKGSSKKRKV
jgi:hypothetical protein